jgi:hypothetical protein
VGTFENQGLYHYTQHKEELWHRIQQVASEIKKNPESSNSCKFRFHAELSCVSVNVEIISNTSCKKVKMGRLLIALLFVFFLYITCYTQEVIKVTMKLGIRVVITF